MQSVLDEMCKKAPDLLNESEIELFEASQPVSKLFTIHEVDILL